jgi:site-specific DNA-cytosine methylase
LKCSRNFGLYGIFFAILVGTPLPANAQERGMSMVVKEALGADATIGKQWAVFVAIDRYKEWTPLKNPVKDAIGEVDPEDALHQSASLSEKNMRRIKSSKPGGTWRDWSKTLVADCHKKETGKSYPSVYGRMSWDAPAPTMTTQFFGFGNGRFGHPVQDRAISFREGAILQSFPTDYQFIPPDTEICKRAIGRLIGNAVPVAIGELIGASLYHHLSQVGK